MQRRHATCPSHRTGQHQSPDLYRVFWLPIPCSFLDKIFDSLHWGVFVLGRRKHISWYFQCRFWSSWESFSLNFPENRRMGQDELPDHIYSHGVCDSFSRFYERKLFIWNAWYRKYHGRYKELFIWAHLTMCCDRKIWEKERGHQDNYFIHFIYYCLIVMKYYFKTFVHITHPHKTVLPGSSPLHHASFSHLYRHCFSFWTQLLLWFHSKSPFWACGIITSTAMGWS